MDPLNGTNGCSNGANGDESEWIIWNYNVDNGANGDNGDNGTNDTNNDDIGANGDNGINCNNGNNETNGDNETSNGDNITNGDNETNGDNGGVETEVLWNTPTNIWTGSEQSDQIYTLLCNTKGDTVKLSKSTGNIAVFELAITGTELRKQEFEIIPRSATQSETHQNDEDQYSATHAIDKDLQTLSIANSYNVGGGWIKLHFDKSYFIQKIIIYYRFSTNWFASTYHCAVVQNFRDCVINDNNVDVSVYQGAVKQKSCGTLQLTYGLEQADQIYTLVCNAKGDTVKLSKSVHGFITLSEIVVIQFCGDLDEL
ncbi:hypothetical protein ACHWQZ_G000740 [Mnemiopsis leidyi]